jgi:hypothetical protein
MTLKWSWHSISMVVEDEDVTQDIKRGELFVLGSTNSTLHFFGAGSEKRQIRGLVIGDTDMLTMKSYAISDSAGVLVTDQGALGTWKINGTPKFSRVKFAGGTIDGVTYTASTPIYRAEIELILSIPEVGP